eukprot:14584840-Alexandrium_andersonii.AAC.1
MQIRPARVSFLTCVAGSWQGKSGTSQRNCTSTAPHPPCIEWRDCIARQRANCLHKQCPSAEWSS